MSATYSAIHMDIDRGYSPNMDNDALSESEMWSVIERDIGALPVYLKNILSINGYNHLLSLEELDESAIQEVEKFARENMRNYVPNTEAYFYIFKKNPSDFRIVSGHRKLLLKLCERIKNNGIQYYTQLRIPVVKMSPGFYGDDDISQSSPLPLPSPLPPPPPLQLQQPQPSLQNIKDKIEPNITLSEIETPVKQIRKRKQSLLPNIYNEDDKIRMLVYNWFLKYTDDDIGIETIGTAVCETEDRAYGIVACPLCTTHVKIGAERNKNGSHRWIISNYVKHFQKHHPSNFKPDKAFKIEIS